VGFVQAFRALLDEHFTLTYGITRHADCRVGIHVRPLLGHENTDGTGRCVREIFRHRGLNLAEAHGRLYMGEHGARVTRGGIISPLHRGSGLQWVLAPDQAAFYPCNPVLNPGKAGLAQKGQMAGLDKIDAYPFGARRCMFHR